MTVAAGGPIFWFCFLFKSLYCETCSSSSLSFSLLPLSSFLAPFLHFSPPPFSLSPLLSLSASLLPPLFMFAGVGGL